MLFGQDRSRLRRYYRQAWQKKLAGRPLETLEALIASVIEQHPEYQDMLGSEDALHQDFTPEQGQTNPFLHMGMHISLAEQISTDRPPGIRDLHQGLSTRLGNPHQAEHQMMECLGLALWEAQQQNRAPDEQAYLECLKKLL
ncbi:DUF1841 family protein [Thiolapillus brandeum]|uniref:DUF1841 family protein n=1 Tax=Thiolapillus brandeum TaxID=1076588 RepID=A0A7U6JHG7_9GAMM|nr:DUF1841 family protein [Thiolapillus brandeum]BAO43762.1 conserved hypothetical protein [Thiolapillus brandeum]